MKSVTPLTPEEIESMREGLAAIRNDIDLEGWSARTPEDVLRAARIRCVDATPVGVLEFIEEKLLRNGPRSGGEPIRSWGGIVHITREDFDGQRVKPPGSRSAGTTSLAPDVWECPNCANTGIAFRVEKRTDRSGIQHRVLLHEICDACSPDPRSSDEQQLAAFVASKAKQLAVLTEFEWEAHQRALEVGRRERPVLPLKPDTQSLKPALPLMDPRHVRTRTLTSVAVERHLQGQHGRAAIDVVVGDDVSDTGSTLSLTRPLPGFSDQKNVGASTSDRTEDRERSGLVVAVGDGQQISRRPTLKQMRYLMALMIAANTGAAPAGGRRLRAFQPQAPPRRAASGIPRAAV